MALTAVAAIISRLMVSAGTLRNLSMKVWV